jgi:hypothetical protein
MPGGTPYVRSAADLERFLGKCRRYFDHFFGRLNGVGMTPLQLKAFLANGADPSAQLAGQVR